MPRRKRRTSYQAVLLLVAIVVVIAGIALVLEIIQSSFGVILAAGLIVTAIVYGTLAAKSQARTDQLWRDVSRLRSLSGAEFERHVADTYRKLGYQAILTPTHDQGADVIAEKSGERIAIQCKHWGSSVGNDAVQQAIAGKAFYKCNQAVVICTSGFTSGALELAGSTGTRLITGTEYAQIVDNADAGERSGNRPATLWLPHGRPLATQLGIVTLGLVVLVGHFGLATSASAPASAVAPPKGVVPTAVLESIASSSLPAAVQSPTSSSFPGSAATPTSTAIDTPLSPTTPTEVTSVVIGNTGGIGAYIRHSPHLVDRWIAWPDGTTLVVLGPEVNSDGSAWLPVRDPSGPAGWIPTQYTVH
jgi:HJR/Mrr/RecB family endonuclease